MKRIFAVSIFVFFLFLASLPVWQKAEAACSFPKKYDCNNIIDRGPNLVTNIHEDNLKAIRDQMGGSNAVIKITVALTDQVIADKKKVDAYLKLLTDNGFLPTIRIYGVPAAKDAGKIGSDLSAALSRNGLTGIPVEFANEPNLEYPGGDLQQKAKNFAQAFNNFTDKCANCQVYLPALGGTSLGNKEQFAKSMMALLNQNTLNTIKGIAFNSYADTGLGAITDWLNTLEIWKEATGNKLNFNSLSYFLTEVGPAGADINTPNLEAFAQSIVDEFNKLKSDKNYCQTTLGEMCGSFQQLSGFSFFIWDGRQNLYTIFVDANGKAHLIKQEQTRVHMPSTTDPAAQDFSPDTPTAPFTHPPQESIEICPGDDFPVPPARKTAPNANVTTTPPVHPGVLISTPQLREDANLRFGQPVKVRGDYLSKLCAQKQGEPIILQEDAYYNILDKGCIERPWKGELTVSGMKIPFAQAIADHWAGTMDTEHLTPYEFDQLMADARQLGTIGEKARNEINLRAGVIKKLLPQESLDQLKCDFVKYVFKRSYRKSTQYQDYMPDGKTKLTAFASIPPGCRNQNECTEINTSTSEGIKKKTECMKKWDEKYGDAWSKISILPNEEAKGQLKFMVCGDKQYILSTAVPEVFRLGLAANILQQTMNSKEKMDLFYEIYPELKDPLSGDSFVQNTNQPKTIAQKELKKPDFLEKLAAKIPFLTNIIGSIKNILPQMQTVLAQAREIYKNPSRLLAQVQNQPSPKPVFTVRRTISCEVVGNSINVTLTSQRLGAKQGHARTDFYIDGTKQNGSPEAPYKIFVWDDDSGSVSIPLVPGKNVYSFGAETKTDVKAEWKKQCDNQDITTAEDQFNCVIDLKSGITKNKTVANKNFYENGICELVDENGNSAEGGPQCGNGSCNFSMAIPSASPQPDTQVLLKNEGSYQPRGKFTIGTKFKIQNNPSEESVKKCLSDPTTCERLATNQREIGVYNNVPMLATAWLQSAGKIALNPTTTLFGFLNNIKPWGLEGSTGISAFDLGNFCSSDQNVVLNEKGEYKNVDAVSKVTYGFRQTAGNSGSNTSSDSAAITERGDQCATSDDCFDIDGLTQMGCSGAPRKCRYKDASGNQVTPDQLSSDNNETDYIIPNTITERGDQCALADDCPENEGLVLAGCTGAPRKCRYKDAQGNPVTLGGASNNISSDGVRVKMVSPAQRNLLWYRLKGLCNANKWWSEKVLNPLYKTLGTGLVSYEEPSSPLSGQCANCDTPLADFPPATGEDGNLCGWKRPVGDTGRCIHFRVDKSGYIAAIGGEKEAGEWAHIEDLIKEMAAMGMKWTTVFYSSDVELAKAAQLFQKYGITPVWRRNLKVDQLRSGEFARDVEIVKKAGLEPYFQIYNEPEIDREWKSGSPDVDVFANNWISAAIEIYNAGGKPGLQVIDEDYLAAVLDRINEIGNSSNPSIKKLFNNMFFVPHLYAERGRDGVDASGVGVTNFELYANVFKEKINYVPPFIVGEAGYLDKYSSAELANKYEDIFKKLQNGQFPNYVFAYCPWIIESNIDEFRGPAWYNTLDGSNRTELIERIKNMSKAPAANMCR